MLTQKRAFIITNNFPNSSRSIRTKLETLHVPLQACIIRYLCVMTEISPPSPPIPLSDEAKKVYNDIIDEIKSVPYNNETFVWGRAKSLSENSQRKWKDAFAGQHDVRYEISLSMWVIDC